MVGLKSVDPAKYRGWNGAIGAEGCELDVDNMKLVISSAGDYKIKTLKTQQATASAILTGIESAADALNSGDTFVFYYSGHGGRKETVVSPEEPDGYNETLIAYDREIKDNELAKLWLKFASGVRVVMLSDSCNSGTNFYFIAIQKPKKPINFTGKVPGMKAQLIHFGACRDGQASASFGQGGAFTLALCEIWNSGKFSGTYRQFYNAIKARLIKAQLPNLQEPQFNFFGKIQPAFRNSRPFSL